MKLWVVNDIDINYQNSIDIDNFLKFDLMYVTHQTFYFYFLKKP